MSAHNIVGYSVCVDAKAVGFVSTQDMRKFAQELRTNWRTYLSLMTSFFIALSGFVCEFVSMITVIGGMAAALSTILAPAYLDQLLNALKEWPGGFVGAASTLVQVLAAVTFLYACLLGWFFAPLAIFSVFWPHHLLLKNPIFAQAYSRKVCERFGLPSGSEKLIRWHPIRSSGANQASPTTKSI